MKKSSAFLNKILTIKKITLMDSDQSESNSNSSSGSSSGSTSSSGSESSPQSPSVAVPRKKEKIMTDRELVLQKLHASEYGHIYDGYPKKSQWPSTNSPYFQDFVSKMLNGTLQGFKTNDFTMKQVDTTVNNCAGTPPRPLKLQPYQEIMPYIIGPNSPLKRLLYVASPGAGKTCTMFALLSAFRINALISKPKPHRKVPTFVFVTPGAVQSEEIYKQAVQCPGPIFDVLQAKDLLTYNKENAPKIKTILTKHFRVKVLTYVQLSKQLTMDTKEFPRTQFHNSVFFMDEIHNLVDDPQFVNGKLVPTFSKKALPEQRKALLSLYRKLKNQHSSDRFKDAVLIGFTATPIVEQPEDMILLINMLFGKKFVDPNTFHDTYVVNGSLTKDPQLCNTLRMSLKNTVAVYDNQHDVELPALEFHPVKIVEYSEKHEKAIKTTKQKNLENFSNIPLADTYPKPTEKLREKLEPLVDDDEAFLSELSKYSPKFSAILREVLELYTNHLGKQIIFSDQKSTGTRFMRKVLEMKGYSMFKGDGSDDVNGKMFIFLDETSDETLSAKAVKRRLDAFNSPANLNGENIPIAILGSKFAEGVNFKGVRALHFIDQPRSIGHFEQVVGRARRFCSHGGLEFPAKWKVDVYQYILRSPTDQDISIDWQNYIHRQREETLKHEFMELIGSVALDCTNNRARTHFECLVRRDFAQPGSLSLTPLSGTEGPSLTHIEDENDEHYEDLIQNIKSIVSPKMEARETIKWEEVGTTLETNYKMKVDNDMLLKVAILKTLHSMFPNETNVKKFQNYVNRFFNIDDLSDDVVKGVLKGAKEGGNDQTETVSIRNEIHNIFEDTIGKISDFIKEGNYTQADKNVLGGDTNVFNVYGESLTTLLNESTTTTDVNALKTILGSVKEKSKTWPKVRAAALKELSNVKELKGNIKKMFKALQDNFMELVSTENYPGSQENVLPVWFESAETLLRDSKNTTDVTALKAILKSLQETSKKWPKVKKEARLERDEVVKLQREITRRLSSVLKDIIRYRNAKNQELESLGKEVVKLSKQSRKVSTVKGLTAILEQVKEKEKEWKALKQTIEKDLARQYVVENEQPLEAQPVPKRLRRLVVPVEFSRAEQSTEEEKQGIGENLKNKKQRKTQRRIREQSGSESLQAMAPAAAAGAGAGEGAGAEALPNASALQKELADLLGSPRTGENIAPEAALANASALQQRVADIVEQMSQTKGSKPPPPRPSASLGSVEKYVEKQNRLLTQDKEIQTKKNSLKERVKLLLDYVQSFQEDFTKKPSSPTQAEEQLKFINNFKESVKDISLDISVAQTSDKLEKIEEKLRNKENLWLDNFTTPTQSVSTSLQQRVADIVKQKSPGSKPPPPPRPATALSPPERAEKYERLLAQDKELETKKKQLKKGVMFLIGDVASFQKDFAKQSPKFYTKANQKRIKDFKTRFSYFVVELDKTGTLDELTTLEKRYNETVEEWIDIQRKLRSLRTPFSDDEFFSVTPVQVQQVAVAPQQVAVSPQQVAVSPQQVAVSPQQVVSPQRAVSPQQVVVAPRQKAANGFFEQFIKNLEKKGGAPERKNLEKKGEAPVVQLPDEKRNLLKAQKAYPKRNKKRQYFQFSTDESEKNSIDERSIGISEENEEENEEENDEKDLSDFISAEHNPEEAEHINRELQKQNEQVHDFLERKNPDSTWLELEKNNKRKQITKKVEEDKKRYEKAKADLRKISLELEKLNEKAKNVNDEEKLKQIKKQVTKVKKNKNEMFDFVDLRKDDYELALRAEAEARAADEAEARAADEAEAAAS